MLHLNAFQRLTLYQVILCFLLCGGLLILINGCKKEEIVISLVPSISFVDVTPNNVEEYVETVAIVISYEDGNADIGQPDPDVPVVFVKDSRLQQPDGYHLPPIAPLDAQVYVKGQLTIPLKNLFILGNTNSEQVLFRVYLTDRAGNVSNTITTPAVTVYR